MKHSQDGIQAAVTFTSLAWLLAANTVGLLLASLLIWPSLNTWIQPLTYGRWMPLHLDWQLYGWCSLPLLGLLLVHFLGHREQGPQTSRICLGLWSAGLLAGGMSWLGGNATGKIFLNWQGFGGLVFASALYAIWALLAQGWMERIRLRDSLKETRLSLGLKAAALAGLAIVPIILLRTSDPTVYPPINPESGGATGHSLLLSTLSLVLIIGLLPGNILGLARTPGAGKAARYFWSFFAVSLAVYLLIEHGNASNHRANQIIGLGTLLAWPGLIWNFWRRYSWKPSTLIWLWAFIGWWSLLALDGWIIFLPGVLEVAKFTNVLVGHSHLAMGGMVSALNIIILLEMGGRRLVTKVLGRKTPFFLWNTGCLVYVVAMTLQGWREGLDPAVLYGFDRMTEVAYFTRWGAGLAMLGANLYWCGDFVRLFLGKYETVPSRQAPQASPAKQTQVTIPGNA